MSCCLSFRPLRRTDLQQVNVELRILFEPDASSLPRIYQELGEDYHERVLPSICNEVCKAVIVSGVFRPRAGSTVSGTACGTGACVLHALVFRC